MWRVAQAGPTLFNLTAGGHQGGEGNDAGAEFFVEGVREELDAPNEFFFDAASQTLLFFPNATANATAPPAVAELVAPQFSRLFWLAGVQEAPIYNVSFVNLSERVMRAREREREREGNASAAPAPDPPPQPFLPRPAPPPTTPCASRSTHLRSLQRRRADLHGLKVGS
jgi:hypothetical protein